MSKPKVLVAGADGYIGNVLVRVLQEAEFDVIGFDTGFYSDALLYHRSWDLPKIISKDVRRIEIDDIRDIYAVICLSDLTDSISQFIPGVARIINFEGLKRFSSLCKEARVRHFIYSSSASVYGVSDEIMNEKSEVNPQTEYAICKSMMERHLLSICDGHFNVVCLRNATVYGLSPRMRFDLVVNYLCGAVAIGKTIELRSDGKAWRPFVHIEDLCNVFSAMLKLPDHQITGQIFNVGDERENYRVLDLVRLVQDTDDFSVSQNMDVRSYRIEASKLNRLGLYCEKELGEEIRKERDFLKRLNLREDVFGFRSYMRLDQIKYLLETKQVDRKLYWI